MTTRIAVVLFAALSPASLLVPAAPAGAQPIVRLGAIGDSLTDEYFESTYDYARNWAQLLVEEQAISMGPLAAILEATLPEGSGWGEPRRSGYEDNWARDAATTDDALAAGQHTGLAQGVLARGVSHAVLFIGANDFAPLSGAQAWTPIYNGTWTQGDIDARIANRMLNFRAILDALLPTGVDVVLASVPDVTGSPLVDFFFPDIAGQERVAQAVEDFSLAIRALADEKNLVFADGWALTRAFFGPNPSPRLTLLVGNVAIDMTGVDTVTGAIPTAAFVDDGVHPNTVLQGITANLLLAALRHYEATQTLFSESELLANAGITYGGSDTLEAELGGPIESFVTDFYTVLRDGFEAGDTGGWSATVP